MPTACPVEPIDLRSLPAPLPLERVMDALLGDPGRPKLYLVPHKPVPLMAMLAHMGVPHATRLHEGAWQLLVGLDRFEP